MSIFSKLTKAHPSIKKFPVQGIPKTKDEWLAYVNYHHDLGLERRRAHEVIWTMNLAYAMGFQRVNVLSSVGVTQILRESLRPTSGNADEMLYINRIGSYTDARISKLSKQRPIPRVIPNSASPEDKRAARISDKALLHLWRKIDMEAEYDKLFFFLTHFGNGFIGTLWDEMSGDYIREVNKTSDDVLILDPDDPAFATKKIFLGEIWSEALSPFQVIPSNSYTNEMWKQDFIIFREFISKAEFKRRFPEYKGDLPSQPELRTEYEKICHEMLTNVIQTAENAEEAKKDELSSEVLIKQMWMKPNYAYEKGVIVTLVGNNLVHEPIQWPNDYGQRNIYPFVKFSEKNDPLRFWQKATISDLIPIQRVYNQLKRQKAKAIALMSSPKWLVPMGSQIPQDALTDEVGEVVTYNSQVGTPKAAEISPLPNYIIEFEKALLADFRDVAGQRETSLQPPQGITAGVALQVLSELEDLNLSPIIKRVARGMGHVAFHQLMLMDQEYDDPRLLQILEPDGKLSVITFKNTDLRGNTDVHIEVESLFPELRGQKAQKVLDLWDRRIIQDPKQVMQALTYGTFDMLMEEEEKQEEAIWLDIQRIKNGKQPEINPAQNHMHFVNQLSKFINTPDFMALPPDRKQLAIQNLQAHLQFIMPSLPGGGEPIPQQNQAAVGSPYGPRIPQGGPQLSAV